MTTGVTAMIWTIFFWTIERIMMLSSIESTNEDAIHLLDYWTVDESFFHYSN